MLDLPDDCIKYLFNINYPCFENVQPLFLICKKMQLTIDSYIHDIFRRDYKLIIRDNHLENPLKTFKLIYKIYGDKFVMCRTKLSDLAIQSIITNNMELLDLIHKNAANSMKSQKIISKLFINALDVKSLNIIIYLFEQHSILEKETFENITDHYYSKRMNIPIIIKTIIDKNMRHKDIIIYKALLYGDLDTLKLFINNENSNEILIRAIQISNIKTCIYIIENFEYNEDVIRRTINSKPMYMTKEIVDALDIACFK